MLDAGHGGYDLGSTYNGRQEKDDTLRLALAVGEVLQNNGIDVQYTRTMDTFVPLYDRAAMANEAGVDGFVSIHRNSYPTDNELSGVQALDYDLSGIKYEMAQNINKELETIGFVDLGVNPRPNLVVLKATQMPAVLVEAGFINSDTDNMLVDQNFDAIAQAIADGIMGTLETEPVGNLGTPDAEPVGDLGTLEVDPEGNGVSYSVQVGLFRNPAYARRLLNELTVQDFPAYIDDYSGRYDRVLVGALPTLDEATAMERRLKSAGYQTLVISNNG